MADWVAPAQKAPAAARPRGGSLRALHRWNGWLGALHFAQGIAVLALATSFALPVNASFLTLDRASGSLSASGAGRLSPSGLLR